MPTVQDYHDWVAEVRRVDPTFGLVSLHRYLSKKATTIDEAVEKLREKLHDELVERAEFALRSSALSDFPEIRAKLKEVYDGRMPHISEHSEIYFSLDGNGLVSLLHEMGYRATPPIPSKTWQRKKDHLLNWCPAYYSGSCKHSLTVEEYPFINEPHIDYPSHQTPYMRLMSFVGGATDRVYII